MAVSERVRFIWAESIQESGGNYRAISPAGALGRWQIMPANLPGWARQCGMPVVSPSYFLDHPLYQNRMVDCVLGGYYDRYGPRGAAAMWYSGQPNPNATFGNPPVFRYVDDVIAIMRSGNARAISGIGAGHSTGGISGKPIPTRADDWSSHIIRAGEQGNGVAGSMLRHARVLKAILGKR